MIKYNLPKEKSEFVIKELLINLNGVMLRHQKMFFTIIYDLSKQEHELNLKKDIVDHLIYYIKTDTQLKVAMQWIQKGGYINDYELTEAQIKIIVFKTSIMNLPLKLQYQTYESLLNLSLPMNIDENPPNKRTVCHIILPLRDDIIR